MVNEAVRKFSSKEKLKMLLTCSLNLQQNKANNTYP